MATARADIEAAKKQVEDQHRRLLAQSAEIFSQASEKRKQIMNKTSPECKLYLKLLDCLCVQFSPQHRRHRDATHISSALNQMRVMEAGINIVSALDNLLSGTQPLYDAHSDKDYVAELKARMVECLGSESIIRRKHVPESTVSAILLRVNSAQLFVLANYLLSGRESRELLQKMAGARKVMQALRFSQTQCMDNGVAEKALDEYESRVKKHWSDGGSPPSWNYVVTLAHAQVQEAKVRGLGKEGVYLLVGNIVVI